LKPPKTVDHNTSNSDDNMNSPDHKSSKTDQHLLNTLLKKQKIIEVTERFRRNRTRIHQIRNSSPTFDFECIGNASILLSGKGTHRFLLELFMKDKPI
jgi:hypothetical protein